jgi:hypothetical protein
VTSPLVLLLVGGFLLGGAWSVWRLGSEEGRGRTTGQAVLAVALLAAAVLATASGILRLL